MPGVHVDGMDVLKVREVVKEVIGRARRREGPTLVECETYRFRGHSLADPDELRDPDERPLPPCSRLLENVFADPKGFGIRPDGSYRCADPKFTQGTAHV
ncbi:hypothetical protein ACE6H2_006976 [Prunus campanulata]